MRARPSPQGINEEDNEYISGRLARLLSRGWGASPLMLASQLCTAGCYLVKSKLYHLLSLVHRRLRIWKAVTKFICAEQEQIAWSRCYKGDKTKVAPSEGSAACVRILSLWVCVCGDQASHVMVFFLQKQMDKDTKERRRWRKNGGENAREDWRSPAATTNPWPHLNIVPSVTKQAKHLSMQNMRYREKLFDLATHIKYLIAMLKETNASSLSFCPLTVVPVHKYICVSYQHLQACRTRFRNRKQKEKKRKACWCLKPRYRSLQTRDPSGLSTNIWTRTSHQRRLDLIYRGLGKKTHIKKHCWHSMQHL